MMSEFELLRNIPIGQYIAGDTPIHRMDPRSKIVVSLLLFFTVTFIRALIPAILLLILMLIATWLARLPFRYILRTLISSLPILFIFLLLALLFMGWQDPTGNIFLNWGWIRITQRAVQLVTLSVLRLLTMLFVISVPSLTTPLTLMTHGVEKLLLPLNRFGVPANEIALVITIALRFVPTLAEEMEHVMKAQASRCGAIGDISWRKPVQMGQALIPLIVPLFVNAFRRAEELAQAMEARAYSGGQHRTSYIQLESSLTDWLAVAGVIAFIIVLIWVPWPALSTLLF